MKTSFCFSLLVALCLNVSLQAEETLFSGPQIGEKLPPLLVKGVIGENANKEFDLMKTSGDSPVVVVFFHKRTRPAFGLTNTMMKYANSRKKDGLISAVVFLTSDATETEKWMGNVSKHFTKGVEYALSPDGQEGPGAYGLNRNVTLTVLVGKNGKVTQNFALVQPSTQADGPKILKAIVAAVGSGEVPDIRELEGDRYRGQQDRRMKAADDPKLGGLLRAVINKQATKEEVAKAAKEIEDYIKDDQTAQQQLGRITNTVVNSDRFQTYGTDEARAYLKKWAKEYPAPKARNAEQRKKVDSLNGSNDK